LVLARAREKAQGWVEPAKRAASWAVALACQSAHASVEMLAARLETKSA
jgi:hypothetical protein